MALVVQKYGGSSLENAERIRRVAALALETRADILRDMGLQRI